MLPLGSQRFAYGVLIAEQASFGEGFLYLNCMEPFNRNKVFGFIVVAFREKSVGAGGFQIKQCFLTVGCIKEEQTSANFRTPTN